MKQDMFGDFFEILAEAMRPNTNLMELSAYWEDGKRYCKGDKVYLDKSMDSWTKDTNVFTHVITKCMGNVYSTKFEITFEDLETELPYIVKI